MSSMRHARCEALPGAVLVLAGRVIARARLRESTVAAPGPLRRGLGGSLLELADCQVRVSVLADEGADDAGLVVAQSDDFG
jgi:hypothetical protein